MNCNLYDRVIDNTFKCVAVLFSKAENYNEFSRLRFSILCLLLD